MNKNLLIFITYEYPYGLSETFIESEILFLSKNFDRITIVPSRIFFSRKFYKKIYRTPHRQLPENCDVAKLNHASIKEYLLILNTFFKLFRYARLQVPTGSSLFRTLKETVKETIKSSLFYARTNSFFQGILQPFTAYSYWKSPAVFSLCLKKIQEDKKFVIATRCHGGDLYYDLPDLPSRPYDLLVSNIADHVIPISTIGLNHLIKNGFKKDKVTVFRLGVLLPKQTNHHSNDGIWRIVSCSNIIPIKRVPLIATALSKINHPFIWTHFGDGIEMSIVTEIVKTFPAHSKAILLGRRPNYEVLKFYLSEPVDIFINISTSEGIPVSIMEALSAGIPCIATDVGGTSEIVDSNVGKLLPIEVNEYILAKTIENELLDTSTAKIKRIQARKRAESMCDAKFNYNKFSHFLKSLPIDTCK